MGVGRAIAVDRAPAPVPRPTGPAVVPAPASGTPGQPDRERGQPRRNRSYLVRQARTPGARQPDWTIAAAGIALPDLVRIAATLFRRPAGLACDIGDLEAAALGGFYAELRRTDSGDTRDPRMRRRLLMAAYRAARTLRDTSTNSSTNGSDDGTGNRADVSTPHAARNNRRGGSGRPLARALERDRQRARHARSVRRRGHARDEQVRP